VRQGDPISPILFLLAMKLLQLLFKKAMQAQLINKLTPNCDSFRVSLYADDAALFPKPSKDDLDTINCILDLFADSSGSISNLSKTQAFPIRCDRVDLSFLTDANIPVVQFPYSYLDLLLHFRRPSKSSLHPLVMKIGDRLTGWKMDLLSYPGRELLIKTVLSSMPTYWLTVFKSYKSIISNIDQYRRSFLCRGKDPEQVKGGHCLVNWQTCLRPKYLEGLASRTLISLVESSCSNDFGTNEI
jgi:hypothetical protein